MEAQEELNFVLEVLTVVVVHHDKDYLLLHDLVERRMVATPIWNILSVGLGLSVETLRELLLTLIAELLNESDKSSQKIKNWERLKEIGIDHLKDIYIVQDHFIEYACYYVKISRV